MLAMSVISKGFRIGEDYPGIYLSYIELQIILGLLRGKQPEQLAVDLGIACRSLDYHCYNMMKLLGFDALEELLDGMRQNEALGQLY